VRSGRLFSSDETNIALNRAPITGAAAELGVNRSGVAPIKRAPRRFYGWGFQFSMTVMGELACSVTVATRNRSPSEETMYW
jgi:hypothetical protein